MLRHIKSNDVERNHKKAAGLIFRYMLKKMNVGLENVVITGKNRRTQSKRKT